MDNSNANVSSIPDVSLTVAFLEKQLDVRGTTVAMYDYAHYNEELLKNRSIIVIPRSGFLKSEIKAIIRLVSRFSIFTFDTLEELDNILKEENVNVLYSIKYGKNDGIISKVCKNAIHCVFDMSEPHGDVYAGVSDVIAAKYNQKLYVPHMISLKPSETKENLRKELNIPKNAIVFGRYGGLDTFNLKFCWEAIKRIVTERKDVYFLFINTEQIVKHPQIFYLSKITSEKDKNRFICTCDAHLECGNLGHSFGLAIGEFSVNNKPIIAYNGPGLWNDCHLRILGNKGLYYRDENSFYEILNTFQPSEKDYNCYREYTPENVMKKFKKVFLTK